MAFKFVAFFALAAAASAVPVGFEHRPAYSDATAVSFSSVSSSPTDAHAKAPAYAAPAPFVHAVPNQQPAPAHFVTPAHQPTPAHFVSPAHHTAQEYAPAQYAFAYEVNDQHTGDVHGQQESREGDVVKGSYSLVEADGSRRIVEYTVDAHSGFNAVVHREATTGHAHAHAAPQVAHAYAAPRLGAAKAAFSAAPVVSYSSVSAPDAHANANAAPASYYH